MDPTQCLKEIAETLKQGSQHGLDADACFDLQERLENLGNWIKNGGFLPEQWRK